LAELLVKNDRWTEDAIASFWTRLRTNQRLLELWINVDADQCGRFVALARDTIAKYNWTLDRFRPNWGQADCLGSLFNENKLVREAVAALKGKEYSVEPLAIWPDILGLMASKPTLLYRFLRRKKSDSFCTLALALNARREAVRKTTNLRFRADEGRQRAPLMWVE
jgi:hypothetical protein